jgi:predicted AAA+ superfamily ATPase
MMGQLHDAGNTTTLAHYQRLLESAQILKGLPKWSGGAIRRRASSPKWIVLNTALITAVSGLDFKTWREDPGRWGRLTEVAVGAHLINTSFGTGIDVYYWRDHNREVDFILKQGDKLLAIEVKTGVLGRKHSGLAAFKRKYPYSNSLLVGPEGIPVIEFISQPANNWMKRF